jgi:hypothetical protein
MLIQRQLVRKIMQTPQHRRMLRQKDLIESPARPAAATVAREGGRRPRRLRRLVLALAGIPCALIISAGTASAATAAQWSPYIPPQQWNGYFGNCTIKSGPVYDPYTTSDGRFAVIGGGQLVCGTVHSYRITVQEYFSQTGVGASYYPQAGSNTYSATNYGFSGILETGRLCGNGYWFTRVTVSATGYAPLYFDSNAHYVSAALC